MIKVEIKFKKFYKNPITGKWNFLHTICPFCGKKAPIRKKNIGISIDREFIYCNDCKIKGIINTKHFILCPKLHLIKNRIVYIKKNNKYFHCKTCNGLYLIMDCKISDIDKF